jgi:predicted metallo-beta-lactamase superfamily hydrolase
MRAYQAKGYYLEEIVRELMRLLAEQSKVIIANHPIRKKQYCYGLSDRREHSKQNNTPSR